MKPLYRIIVTILGLRFLQPGLRVPALFLLGAFFGTVLLLIQISKATSYMSNASETCMNCHVMNGAYISWKHSSHSHRAVCNDCHVPHTSYPREYAFKAHDGLRHAAIFTLHAEKQSIRLSEAAKPVVQENCLRCHETRLAEVSACQYRQEGDFRCWDCHREVPHGKVHSLSASPNTFAPR